MLLKWFNLWFGSMLNWNGNRSASWWTFLLQSTLATHNGISILFAHINHLINNIDLRTLGPGPLHPGPINHPLSMQQPLDYSPKPQDVGQDPGPMNHTSNMHCSIRVQSVFQFRLENPDTICLRSVFNWCSISVQLENMCSICVQSVVLCQIWLQSENWRTIHVQLVANSCSI